MGRIEFDLNFDILGNGHQRTGQLVDQHFAGLTEGINVAILPIALVRELLECAVFQVAHAKTQYGEEGTCFGFFFHHAHQIAPLHGTDIEIAVGAEDDTVDTAIDIVVPYGLVRQLDAGPAVGAAPGFQTLQRIQNFLRLITRGRRQHQAGRAGIYDDGHPVPPIELAHQHLHGFLHEGQLVLGLHRTGDIQQEHQIAGGTVFLHQLAALEPHAQQVVALIPGTGMQLHMGRKGMRALLWTGVVVLKIIDQLLYAHGIGGRALPILQESPHVAVRGGIDINGEGRQRMLAHATIRILANLIILLQTGAVERLRRNSVISRCAGHHLHSRLAAPRSAP